MMMTPLSEEDIVTVIDDATAAAATNTDTQNAAANAAVLAEVHMAIRSGSYRLLVDDYLSKATPNPRQLLWQTNPLGWTAMHVAASCHDIPLEWWEYLLHQATTTTAPSTTATTGTASRGTICCYCHSDNHTANHDNHNNNNNVDSFHHGDSDSIGGERGRGDELVSSRTSLGYSTIDLFFRTWLDPFPWQRDHLSSSQSLVQGMNDILQSSNKDDDKLVTFMKCLDQLRAQIAPQRRQRGCCNLTTSSSSSSVTAPLRPAATAIHLQADVSDSILEVALFWHRTERLMMYAAAATAGITIGILPQINCTFSPSYSILCMLAHTGCPKIVAQLALRMEFYQHETLAPGLLPLYIWAKSNEHGPERWFSTNSTTSTTTSSAATTGHDDGVLEALLEVYPGAASLSTPHGQLPLHTALAQGKSWKRLGQLFRAHPNALWSLDRSTGLFPFCLAALPIENKAQKISLSAKQAVGSKIAGMWHFLPNATKLQALERAQQQVDADQVTTIYQVLRAFPNAVAAATASNHNDNNNQTNGFSKGLLETDNNC